MSSTSSINKTGYTANWTLERSGRCSPRRAELSVGATARVKPELAGNLDTTLRSSPSLRSTSFLPLRVELETREGTLEKCRVADGFNAEYPKWAPPLPIQVPSESIRRLRTTVPVEYDHAVVMAHHIRQYREIPRERFGMPCHAREHTLYVAVLVRSGDWPEPPLPVVPVPRPACHVVTFAWSQNPAPISFDLEALDRSGEPSNVNPGDVTAQALNHEELAGALDSIHADAGAVAQLIGVALVAEEPMVFEVGKTEVYVAGIAPEPTAEAAGPFHFDLQTAGSGPTLGALFRKPEDGFLTLELDVRLGDEFRLEDNSQRMPAVRALPASGHTETYNFKRCEQVVAKADSINLRVDHTEAWFLLTLPGTTPAGGKSGELLIVGTQLELCPDATLRSTSLRSTSAEKR